MPFDGEPGAGRGAASTGASIRSRERLTYGHAEAILAGRERAGEELTEALELAERRRDRRSGTGAIGAARFGSRRARPSFAFDGEGGVERAWVESEPHAHMLVEELMILANEAVAELLAGRRREALYRVHERPDPQAIELLLSQARGSRGADAVGARAT